VTSPEAAAPGPPATGRQKAAGRSLLGIAFQGAALFLFIPLVLFLFLRQPLGPGWSIAVGLAIMLGHRFVAAPWMAKFADVRCLWCGRVGVSDAFPVAANGRTWTMSACSAEHASLVARFLRCLQRWRLPIGTGIFLPLAWLLLASLAAAAGAPILPHDVNALLFRVVVAVTLVSVFAPERAMSFSPSLTAWTLANLLVLLAARDGDSRRPRWARAAAAGATTACPGAYP
jgi:hypothetical protein